MWRQILASTFVVGSLLFACEAAEPGSNPSEDAGVVIDAGVEAEDGDATTPVDAATKDAAKKDGKVGTGDCAGMGNDMPCLTADGEEWICCGGACVSPYDSKHCHFCSAKCDDGESCGSSGCIGSTCKPGRTTCFTDAGTSGGCCAGSAACTDLQKDPSHCGKCGNACGVGQVCADGECLIGDCTGAPGGATCLTPAGLYGSCCGGVCTNLSTDAHCGSCGAACPPGVSCAAQLCRSDAGVAGCNASTPCGSGKSCVHGRCIEAACNGATEEGYVCALVAPGASGACCGGGCKDLRTDRNHCGRCGNACGAGEWCHEGACEQKVTCAANNSGVACNLANDKTGICCNGACIDALTKESCGACGAGCPTGATCRADGNCVEADGDIAICASSSDCPSGRLCSAGRCLPSTCAAGASGGQCAFGRTTRGGSGTCCNGECVDVTQDKDSCGKCGTTCPSGLCAGGSCVPPVRPCPPGACSPGQQCADGTCVGACSAGPFASFCATSTGALGLCCDHFFSVTCEGIKSDVQNCGGCGVRCPQGQTCQNGVCSGASGVCSEGHEGAYCDLASGESKRCCGGGCVDLKTDPTNCGTCGKTCLGDESCIAGACLLTACTAASSGRACRAGSVNGVCCDGSCVDTKTSESHCGQCNKGCGSGSECRAGRCAVPTCSAPSAGAPCFMAGDALGRCCGTGSCVDTTRDAKNCLGCGIACAPGQVCSNGCRASVP